MDKKFVITISSLSVLFLLIGSGAGYYLYDIFNKAPDEVIAGPAGGSSLGSIAHRNKLVEEALKNDTLVSTIPPHDIVNYAFDIFTSKKYSLVVGQGNALASAGFTKVNQTIISTTYNTPEGFFHQKESDSSFVHAADRYYEDRQNKVIHGYEASRATDWAKTKVKEYTYDSFIQTYGKLNTGNYFCVSSDADNDNPIPEKFLSFDKEEYEQSQEKQKFVRNGALIYNLTKDTVKPQGENSKTSVEKVEEGYKVTIDLEVIGKPYSVSYYAVQMKSTGDLARRPKFSECVLTFDFDAQLNPLSSNFMDRYDADTGVISADTTSEIKQYYFYSDNNTFNGVTINLPLVNEPTFAGFQLLPKQEGGEE